MSSYRARSKNPNRKIRKSDRNSSFIFNKALSSKRSKRARKA